MSCAVSIHISNVFAHYLYCVSSISAGSHIIHSLKSDQQTIQNVCETKCWLNVIIIANVYTEHLLHTYQALL